MSDIQRAFLPARASFAQERMWFLEQLEGEAAAYNQLNTLLIKGPLDVGLLRKSLDEILRRHEALRTTLRFVDGELLQYVSEPQPVDLHFRDLSGTENALQEAERLSVARVKKRFNLSSDSMIEVLLFKIASGEHFLAFITHHAAFDGWSITILVDELSSIYEALHHGAPLPTLPAVQYAEYADWQRGRFDRGELREQLEYWKERLKGELPVLELPIDHVRPATQSFEGDVVERTIPRPVVDSLKVAARGERATMFMALLAAYAAFLFRHTGQEDIIIGFPIAGRTRVDMERSMGLIVNTLPLRLSINGDMTFLELLHEARRAAFEAYERQDIPFEKVVESLQVARQPSTTPVFQTMFQFRNFPTWKVSRDGLEWGRHDTRYNTAKFDLTLETTDTPAGLYCRFEYPPALFEVTTIERMAEHWEILLKGIASGPGQTIGRIPLISKEEAQRAIVEWNDTKSSYPEIPAHRIFEARARESPDALAMVHGGESIMYRELNIRANRLARHLAGLGIKPGMAVAVCMERSIDLVVCELAVLKAGGAFTPIDPSYPQERVRFMADDVDAKVILTRHSMGIEGIDPARLACLSEIGLEGYDAGDLPDLAGADSTAYIIYTSGSTGQPKGVKISHRGIVRLAINTNYASIRPDDRVSFTSNPTFDVSMFDIWGALLNGARLIVFDKATLLSPTEFAGILGKEKVTVLTLTTQLFNLYSQEIPETFSLVRDVYFAGEAADPNSVRRVLANRPSGRLINVYGPTENAVYSTWYEIHNVDGNNVPIGKPISNSTAYVLDACLQPMPAGVPGEIYVGGDGVAQGYHNRPGLTEAAFIPDPFAGGNARLYRTGDVGCYLSDGNIRFIGRRDGQVKIRGFRVEPGEVRAALETHPSVKEAYIMAEPDGAGKRLVAYIRGDVETCVLRKFLRGRLPEYMVPSTLVMVDAFPLTPNGKIDARAFSRPQAGKLAPAEPLDELERTLAGIWEDILGVKPVGVHDDFFDLGGHSLAAVRMFAKMESRLGVKLPISLIFTSPTVRQLAQTLREKNKSHLWQCIVPLKPEGTKPSIFCVHTVSCALGEYNSMINCLHIEQSIYGIQPVGLDGSYPPLDSIEAMAAHYIREIRAFQPQGPYLLMGYSSGGVIAYEMARQLREKGIDVPFLCLIEPYLKNRNYYDLKRAASIQSLKTLAGGSITVLLSFLRINIDRTLVMPPMMDNVTTSIPYRVSRALKLGTPVQWVYMDWVLTMPEPQRQVAMRNFEAFNTYLPMKHKGNAVLFISQSIIDGLNGTALGWEKIIGDKLEIICVPGDHVSMMQPPNVEYLTDNIERLLEKSLLDHPYKAAVKEKTSEKL